MDVDEFMAFLETRPKGEHWHLIEGVAVLMAPPSYAHRRIAHNLCELLNTAFSAQAIDLFAYIGTGVRTPGVRNFQPEPDVVGVAGYDLYSERFHLVAEILSPSNTRAEIDLKLRRYREAPDNLYAVVIEPREILVEIHAKGSNWEPAVLANTARKSALGRDTAQHAARDPGSTSPLCGSVVRDDTCAVT